MIIEAIDKNEYLELLKKVKNVSICCDEEAVDAYLEKEIIKVVKNNIDIAVFLVPLDNNGIRREYRFFPYLSPIFLMELNNFSKKQILKFMFNYLFNKYDYCFIPLHPSFKMIMSIQSEGGFVEMRHTHRNYKKLSINDLSSRLKNHIRYAEKKVVVKLDFNYSDIDFNLAIKGSNKEVEKRSAVAKKMIDLKKGFILKAVVDYEVKAFIICIFDKEEAYLLHSYQDKTIRGVIPLLILRANEYLFDTINIKCFDFEGSVINNIDDFFSSFDVNIVNYPYVIFAKEKEKFYELIERSKNIEGRCEKYENK